MNNRSAIRLFLGTGGLVMLPFGAALTRIERVEIIGASLSFFGLLCALIFSLQIEERRPPGPTRWLAVALILVGGLLGEWATSKMASDAVGPSSVIATRLSPQFAIFCWCLGPILAATGVALLTGRWTRKASGTAVYWLLMLPIANVVSYVFFRLRTHG